MSGSGSRAISPDVTCQGLTPTHNTERLTRLLDIGSAPRPYVLPGLVRGTVGILVAPGGTGKSMWALEACLGVAGEQANRALLELEMGTHGAASYLTVEDDESEIDARMLALAIHTGRDAYIDACERLTIDSRVGHGVDLVSQKWLTHLRSLAKGRTLLIVDTFSRLHGGSENDAGAMAAAVGSLELLARQEFCSILVLHHVGRLSALNERLGDKPRARGSSAITDNARWVAEMACDDDNDSIVRLGLVKANYGTRDALRVSYKRTETGALLPVEALAANVSKAVVPTIGRQNVGRQKRVPTEDRRAKAQQRRAI